MSRRGSGDRPCRRPDLLDDLRPLNLDIDKNRVLQCRAQLSAVDHPSPATYRHQLSALAWAAARLLETD
jgi:hypothetical protein